MSRTKMAGDIQRLDRQREFANSLEVLRQVGHDDWYIYSRFDVYGVRDLLRKMAIENKLGIPQTDIAESVQDRYSAASVFLAADDICSDYGYGK